MGTLILVFAVPETLDPKPSTLSLGSRVRLTVSATALWTLWTDGSWETEVALYPETPKPLH